MRFRQSQWLALAAAFLIHAGSLGAQTAAAPSRDSAAASTPRNAAGTVTVRGVAYDSLRGTPLAGAFVTIDGARSTTADAHGTFGFDSVTLGVHTFAAQHAALDSVGLYGLSASASVTNRGEEVRLATPSFATLWGGVCGVSTPPRDSGFVYGTVSDAAGAPIADATIDLTWFEIGTTDSLGVVQRRWRSQVRSGTNGSYAICGVPLASGLRVQAVTDSAASGLIDLASGGLRVRRRDLRVAALADTAAERRGVIAGIVTDTAGRPIAGARVVTDDVPEVRSRGDGRFELRDVPAGTRQVEVFAIGMSPAATAVDVAAGDTSAVTAQLRRVNTLDVVRVTASRRVQRLVADIEDRKRSGAGYVRDSSAIYPHAPMASVFATFPGIDIVRARGTAGSNFALTMRQTGSAARCVPPVWIDGTKGDFDYLNALRAEEIAVVEVYTRAMHTPIQFASSDVTCGVVAVWTKFALR